jgi:hypothetical protein
VCNGVFFTWLGNIRLNFPAEMRKPIYLAIFGIFGKMKEILVTGLKNVYHKAKSRFSKDAEDVEKDDSQNPNVNNVESNSRKPSHNDHKYENPDLDIS